MTSVNTNTYLLPSKSRFSILCDQFKLKCFPEILKDIFFARFQALSSMFYIQLVVYCKFIHADEESGKEKMIESLS